MKKKPAKDWIPAHWTFESSAVAKRFDAHVREQLPWYDHLLGCIEHFGAHYIPMNGLVYDIGASTGNVGRKLGPYLVDRDADLVAIEASQEMARLWKFPGVRCGRGSATLECADALKFEFLPFDFAVLNLVVMFLPVAERAAFIRKLVGLCRPGGAIIIVDKVLSPPGYLGTVFRRLAMKGKLDAGASAEEILAKELSLGGVQRPINPSIIPVMAQRFFQFGEFTGWIYEKVEGGIEA